MITREELIDSMLHEINVSKFIATKIPAERANWRPGPNQRTVLELMQYLSRAGLGYLLFLVNGNRDHAEPLKAKSEKVTPATFAKAMDEQAAEIRRVIGGLGNARLANDRGSTPWSGPMSLGAAIMNTSVKFLAAYRMQLFLYAKQLGRPELGTSHAWAGRDPAPQPVAAK